MSIGDAHRKKAIVIGGGLAGTSAAFTLNQAGWDVTILERRHRLGGRTETVAKNGYLIDTGASIMATSYSAYLGLAKDAGLGEKVTPASPFVGIVRDGIVHELDMRHIRWSGLWTKLLSWRAKVGLLRLFYDAFVARAKGMLNYNDLAKAAPIDTESASTYALREFSQEVNDYFCDPVTRVMLLADGDKVSKVEFLSGVVNVLDGTMCSMRDGQQSMSQALAQGLDVELEATATEVREMDAGVRVRWLLREEECVETVDACIVACMLHTATELCPDYRSILRPLNRSVRYTKAISVAVGASVLVPTKSFMVFLPKCEEPSIATLFLEHNKCDDRAPSGHSLISAYIEDSACEAYWELDDEEIARRVLVSLYRLFPILDGQVDMTHVKRWSPALPLMQIGAYQEVASLNARLSPAARVQFSGDYRSGAGQNTAVDFGLRAARNIIAHQ